MKAEIASLLHLQEIDLALQVIEEKKGVLPKQVKESETQLADLENEKETLKARVKEYEAAVITYQDNKKQAENLIREYRGQQASTTESRQYDILNKQIALQELEVQLTKKQTKEAQQSIKGCKEKLTYIRAQIRQKKEDAKTYKEQLNTIEVEVEEENAKLQELRPEARQKVEEKLYYTYENMRHHMNPPYVVTRVEKGACGGCFQSVPQQQQVAVLEEKKIIHCGYCHRILSGVIKEEPKKRVRARRKKVT